jgi:GON domain
MTQQTIEWPQTGGLGLGYSSKSDEVKGACLKNLPKEADVGKDSSLERGLKISYDLRVLEDSSQLAEALGVSASVAVKTPSGAGATSRVDFARKHSCDQNSVYVLASIVAEDVPQNLTADQLQELDIGREQVRDQLKNDPVAFLDNYGDSFISGWINGAELHVLLQLKSHSVTDKNQLSAAASGSAGAFSGKAALSSKLETVCKGRDITFSRCQIGGPSLSWKELSVETILTNMDLFDKAVHEPGSKRRYLANLTPYRYLSSLSAIPFGDIDNITRQLDNLARVELGFRDAIQALEYIETYKEQFVDKVDTRALSAQKSELIKACDYLDAELDRVRRLRQLSTVEPPSKIREHAELKPALEVIAQFPRRLARLPGSAEDIRRLFRNMKTLTDPADGPYTIFLDPNESSSGVELYCVFPKDALAQSYITLKNSDDQMNSSSWPASNPSGSDHMQRWRRGVSLRTTYSKIAFDPETMLVDVRDVRFAVTVPAGGHLLDTGFDGKEYETFTHADYGVASASNHELNADKQSRQPFGTANINLGGTAFQIDPHVSWKTTGFDPRGVVLEKPEASNNFQVCRVSCGGAPGKCAPEGGLKLKLREGAPRGAIVSLST